MFVQILQITNFQVNSGTIPLMSNIQFQQTKQKTLQNYRIATPVGTQEGLATQLPAYTSNERWIIHKCWLHYD